LGGSDRDMDDVAIESESDKGKCELDDVVIDSPESESDKGKCDLDDVAIDSPESESDKGKCTVTWMTWRIGISIW
jgi:hypothetical protein